MNQAVNTGVLAIGELLADVITENFVDDLSFATAFRMFQGGSTANVSANLQWLGCTTNIVACVGNDGIGKFLLNELHRTGLNTGYILRSNTHPTSIVMVGRSNATPDFIAYRMADAQIGIVADELIQQSQIVHTCAFALSKQPAQKNILQALQSAAEKGKQISIDWNFAPAIWGDDDGKKIFDAVCVLNPLLKCSLDDVERFAAKTLSIEQAKDFLHALPTMATALTCGKEGVWYRSYENDDWQFQPAAPIEKVQDTTGAGDAFWSGFLHAFLRKYCLKDCIAEGIKIASMKVQKLGPLYQK